MAEEMYECGECGKVFSSEETLESHGRADHGKRVALEKTSGHSFEGFPGFQLNSSMMVGFLAGIIMASAFFGGYLYWDSLDHRQEVPVTVVTCDTCDYEKFRTATDKMFKTSYREVNYDSEEGQELVERYDLKYVPAFIFGNQVENAANFSRVKPALVKFEDTYVIPDEGTEQAQMLSDGISLNRTG